MRRRRHRPARREPEPANQVPVARFWIACEIWVQPPVRVVIG
jgi:hypothetical protein